MSPRSSSTPNEDGAFHRFLYRTGLARPLGTPPPKKIQSPAGNRLSTVLLNEGEDTEASREQQQKDVEATNQKRASGDAWQSSWPLSDPPVQPTNMPDSPQWPLTDSVTSQIRSEESAVVQERRSDERPSEDSVAPPDIPSRNPKRTDNRPPVTPSSRHGRFMIGLPAVLEKGTTDDADRTKHLSANTQTTTAAETKSEDGGISNHSDGPLTTNVPPPAYADPPSLGTDLPKYQQRRGGWGRLLIIFGILTVIVIALAVGLGVGLTMSNNSSHDSSASGSGSDNGTEGSDVFPMGSWSFPTFLTNTSTGCTSNAATWSCPPYNTYNSSSSPSESAYTFSWVINSTTPDAPTNDSLVIMSTANTFSLTFNSTPLTLIDPGTSNERYEFTLNPLPKSVVPSSPITQNGASSLCFFNQTVLRGSLYTRLPASLLTSSGASNATSAMSTLPTVGQAASTQWPGAVYLQQESPAGQGTPDCYPATGTTITGPSIQGIAGAPGQCQCLWQSSFSAEY